MTKQNNFQSDPTVKNICEMKVHAIDRPHTLLNTI